MTFRGSFPALRLSRLNFGGSSSRNNSTPSKTSASILSGNNHLESVAVILPPGTLPNLPSRIYRSTSATTSTRYVNLRSIVNICVQGIWSTWDVPSDTCSSVGSSSTMVAAPSHQPILGGSQAPPSELRLIASHVSWGTNVVSVLDIPLWGEADLGINVEFGTPVRHLISLSPPTTTKTDQEEEELVIATFSSWQ